MFTLFPCRGGGGVGSLHGFIFNCIANRLKMIIGIKLPEWGVWRVCQSCKDAKKSAKTLGMENYGGYIGTRLSFAWHPKNSREVDSLKIRGQEKKHGNKLKTFNEKIITNTIGITDMLSCYRNAGYISELFLSKGSVRRLITWSFASCFKVTHLRKGKNKVCCRSLTQTIQ